MFWRGGDVEGSGVFILAIAKVAVRGMMQEHSVICLYQRFGPCTKLAGSKFFQNSDEPKTYFCQTVNLETIIWYYVA